MERLTKIIEAALFAAARPLSVDELKGLDADATVKTVRAALDELREHLDDGHAIELAEIGGGFQLLSRREFAEVLERARLVQRPRRLSRAALETLAIIAYRQPVSRLEIEDIRGVSSEGVVRMLLERELIDVAGRSEALGRPLLYATTPYFLEHLGLNAVEELPRVDELAVLLRPRGPVLVGEGDGDEDDVTSATGSEASDATGDARGADEAPALAEASPPSAEAEAPVSAAEGGPPNGGAQSEDLEREDASPEEESTGRDGSIG